MNVPGIVVPAGGWRMPGHACAREAGQCARASRSLPAIPAPRRHDDWRQRGLAAAGSDEITGRRQAGGLRAPPGPNLAPSGQLSARLRQHGQPGHIRRDGHDRAPARHSCKP